MAKQAHPYDADLSYHFANLTLAAELQPLWASDEAKHPDLNDLFAIPESYYHRIFLGSEDDGVGLYTDIQTTIKSQYELIDTIHVGSGVLADYQDMAETVQLTDVQNMDDVFKVMQTYTRAISESVSDRVRYGFVNFLIGYVLRSIVDGHGIILLRGTVRSDEWLNNINFRLVPFHPLDTDHGMVHNGFRDIYKGIGGKFRELMATFDEDARLYFIGHSLGGALAQMAAFDIALMYPERSASLDVYTYAAPRVGDQTFVDAYDETVKTSYRVVNICDVVPYLPFETLSEFLDMSPYPYSDTKGELVYAHQAGNPVTNHICSYHFATRRGLPRSRHVGPPLYLD